MAIYARDSAQLDKDASAMARQRSQERMELNKASNEHDYKLAEQKNQADVDVGKAGELLPIEKQQTQDKYDIDTAAKKAQTQNEIEAARGLHDDYSQHGQKLNTKVGGIDISEAPVNQYGFQGKEMGALQKAAKGSIAGPQQDLETADMIHRLAENPSAIDAGTAQVMKARMAMGGSGSKALGSALRQMGMDEKTLSGDAQSWANFFTGNASVKQTPQQINALKEGAFKLGDDASERLARAKQQFNEQAPYMAPTMAVTGNLHGVLPTFSAPADELATRHSQRRQEYMKQAGGNQTGLTGGSAYKQPQGPVDKLRQFLMPGSSQQQRPAGKAKQVIQNGHTYNLNEQTGEYE